MLYWDANLNGEYITTVTGDDYDDAFQNFREYAREYAVEYDGYEEHTELDRVCTCKAVTIAHCICGAYDDCFDQEVEK